MKDDAGRPFWLWMNLLSLDAPLVALIWQDFLARCYAPVLRPPARWVLGLTVWAIYLADRLMDIRYAAAENETARHQFYRQNRRPGGVLLAMVLSADLITAVLWVRPAVFSNGLFLGGGVICYLAFFALWRTGGRRWKQPSAAILFTAGVFLVAWTTTPEPRQVLGWPWAAFWALCFGNLTLIEKWEERRWSGRGWIWMSLLALLCLWLGDPRWHAAVAASALGLAALDCWSRKLSEDARRVLADAVLLTPLFFR